MISIYKEKQRGCPLLGANRYTHIYISYICVYILFIFVKIGETYLIKIEGIFIRNIKNTWWVSQNKRSNAY